MCMKDPADYFAERLHKSMKGVGTDDEELTRLVVSRSEVDLVEIKEAFFNKFNKSLAKMIKVRGWREGDGLQFSPCFGFSFL